MPTDATYKNMLKQMPAGMGHQEEKSFWDKLADQFKARAEPKVGSGPKIDPVKAAGFVKGFK
jgi:hypothetical protein